MHKLTVELSHYFKATTCSPGAKGPIIFMEKFANFKEILSVNGFYLSPTELHSNYIRNTFCQSSY